MSDTPQVNNTTTATTTTTKNTTTQEKPQKSRAVEFNQYLDKRCIIILGPYREITGVIKGWDSLNLVVEDAEESRTLHNDPTKPEHVTRKFPGQLLLRQLTIESIFPVEGYEKIDSLTAVPDQ